MYNAVSLNFSEKAALVNLDPYGNWVNTMKSSQKQTIHLQYTPQLLLEVYC